MPERNGSSGRNDSEYDKAVEEAFAKTGVPKDLSSEKILGSEIHSQQVNTYTECPNPTPPPSPNFYQTAALIAAGWIPFIIVIIFVFKTIKKILPSVILCAKNLLTRADTKKKRIAFIFSLFFSVAIIHYMAHALTEETWPLGLFLSIFLAALSLLIAFTKLSNWLFMEND